MRKRVLAAAAAVMALLSASGEESEVAPPDAPPTVPAPGQALPAPSFPCDAPALGETDEAEANDTIMARAPASPAPGFPRFLRPLSGETNGNQGSYDGDPPDRESSPGPVARRELLFTFDDGPHLDGTPQVLAQLERHKIRAIFFVNGRHLVGHDPAALQRRAILRRVVAAGHLVANHTMNHVDLCRDPTAIEAEIDGNAEVIAATTGKRPVLFRSPYGSRCRRLVEALRLRHLTEVGWNVGGNELDSPDENDIVEDVAAKLGHRAGPAILLLHDSHPSAVKALPWILDFVDEQNQRLRAAGKEPWKIVGPEVLLR